MSLAFQYAPFKESKARTHAQRAKSLGLEETANQIIKGEATVESIRPETLVKPDVKGHESLDCSVYLVPTSLLIFGLDGAVHVGRYQLEYIEVNTGLFLFVRCFIANSIELREAFVRQYL